MDNEDLKDAVDDLTVEVKKLNEMIYILKTVIMELTTEIKKKK